MQVSHCALAPIPPPTGLSLVQTSQSTRGLQTSERPLSDAYLNPVVQHLPSLFIGLMKRFTLLARRIE